MADEVGRHDPTGHLPFQHLAGKAAQGTHGHFDRKAMPQIVPARLDRGVAGQNRPDIVAQPASARERPRSASPSPPSLAKGAISAATMRTLIAWPSMLPPHIAASTARAMAK
jgi:hypothetical protein